VSHRPAWVVVLRVVASTVLAEPNMNIFTAVETAFANILLTIMSSLSVIQTVIVRCGA
jgi:hypothetical protein